MNLKYNVLTYVRIINLIFFWRRYEYNRKHSIERNFYSYEFFRFRF